MTTSGQDEAVDEIARRYGETLRAWRAAAARNLDGAERANRLFDEQRKDLLRLRVDDRGRATIESLMIDPDAGVRLMAASEVLLWDPEPARVVLQRLAADDAAPWQHSFSAKMTLKEFDAGRLKSDW